MDEYWNLRVREYFDGFAAEDDCRNTAASVRGHYNEVTALRFCRINNDLIRMYVLDLDGLTCNPRRICRLSDSAEQFSGVSLNTLLILVGGVFDNLRVEGEDMKWHSDSEHRNFGTISLAKAMPYCTAFPASSEPSVGIRILLYISFLLPLSLNSFPWTSARVLTPAATRNQARSSANR